MRFRRIDIEAEATIRENQVRDLENRIWKLEHPARFKKDDLVDFKITPYHEPRSGKILKVIFVEGDDCVDPNWLYHIYDIKNNQVQKTRQYDGSLYGITMVKVT